MTTLSEAQTDRAVGVLLGSAVGDALGVPYEFGSRPMDEPEPLMVGGGLGNIAPGQWSDDTEMAMCIAQVGATGADLRSPEALEEIARGFLRWYAAGPPDIGNQTRHVLGHTARRSGGAEVMTQISRDFAATHERSAGNGSLMRTGPVVLAHLHDRLALAEAARAVSCLTHADEQAQQACVLWCLAIRTAVLDGVLDVRAGLDLVDGAFWAPLLDDAEASTPARYAGSNGWVVTALQAAWAAVSASESFEEGVVAAVRGGGDTDTVAAIAGALLGARSGAAAIPARWLEPLHGWPDLRAADLPGLVSAG